MPQTTAARGFAAEQRLRRPREYAAVLAAPRRTALRASAGWLAMTAAWTPADGHPAARLGLTISRRMARRAVDRALVKRVVRESFRHAAAALTDAAAAAGQRIDVSLRLARALQPPGHSARPPLTALKRELRADADQLFGAATERLRGLPAERGVAARAAAASVER